MELKHLNAQEFETILQSGQPAMIDLDVYKRQGVVILTAPQPCSFKADAEFNALDGGNPEYNGGNAALHTVKQRAAQTCGQTQHGTFHHAAYGVTLRLGGGNSRRHGRPCVVGCRRDCLLYTSRCV